MIVVSTTPSVRWEAHLDSPRWWDGPVDHPDAGVPLANWSLATVNPTNWTTRALMARWLAQGERCPACKGSGNMRPGPFGECPNCSGTGYLRPPHPMAWALDGIGTGPLTDMQSGFVLACSVVLVDAGHPPIQGLAELHAGADYPVPVAFPDGRTYRDRWTVEDYIGDGWAVALPDGTLRAAVPDSGGSDGR